ncbi:LOW QUALITY PROTEIN: heterokaryon incompatibility protein-domain-containing protein [Copromyces sp. CBS 386.78]|nr:LOW QUALITY PROTEIN: heterokaryon incompatibility protein-domain-containing protein [Copromyces sp. CBS 386.78]
MDDSFPSPPPPTHPELSYTTIPLNTAATEIRLLELFPSADFSSPLHCRLYNTPISSPAPFKALSYAWGSDDKTHLIYCDSNTGDSNYEASFASVANPSSDGEVGDHVVGGVAVHGEEAGIDVGPTPTPPTKTNIIRITTCLDSCLRHLRAIYHSQSDHLPSPQPNPKPMTIWIDQVCIAQSDPYEKAMQVGLMSQIYSRAEQVLVWLGPEADGSDEVMDALAELGREFESVGVNVSDAARLEELAVGFGNGGEGAGDTDGSGEKKKKKKGWAGGNARDKSEKVASGMAEKELKRMRKETVSGADVREGTGTACENAGAPGDVVVGDLDGAGIGFPSAGNLGIADAESLDRLGVTVVCTTDKIDASIGKTLMRVVEEGATRFARLSVSGEMPAFFRPPWFRRVWVVQEACLCADTVFVCGTKPPVNYDILGVNTICMIHAIREFERKGEWDGVSPISTDHEIAGVRISRDATRALGGWVEQISASGLQSPFYRDLDNNFEADGTVTGKDAFRSCGPHYLADMVPTRTAGMLGLRGYLVDTIEEVGGMANREFFTISEPRLHETFGFLENLDRFWELSKRKNEPIYRTPARREEALWRVPVGDMMIDWQHIGRKGPMLISRPNIATGDQYQALKLDMTAPRWKDSVDEDKKNEAKKWAASYLGPNGGKLYDGALAYVAKKSLYLTKKGYMGLGPSDIQSGGARIPFVLRPTSDDNTFTYLGDAYCDGIMDGEITLRGEKQNFFLV